MRNRWLLKISLLVVIVAGCGRNYRVAGFESYVDAFKNVARAHGNDHPIDDLIVEFGPGTAANVDATCYQGDSTPRIVIVKKNWDEMDEAQRTALIFHEMGHCVLGRKHVEGDSVRGCPASLMNPYTVSGYCYTQNRDQYEAELFGAG